MKPGRPISHIKPSYLTWDEGDETEFYGLDSKGNLIQNTPVFREESTHQNQNKFVPNEIDFSFSNYDMSSMMDDDIMFPL